MSTYDKTSHQARVQSYLKAMEALAAKYPDDDEAQIFYAITLNVAASPADKTYANQLKGRRSSSRFSSASRGIRASPTT